MGLFESFQQEMERRRQPAHLTWSVGSGAVPLGDQYHGHSLSQHSPVEYGDYIATSNEIYSVASKRARLLSGLTLRLYAGTDSDKREITTGPAHRLLNYVNPYWTPRRLARMDELAMCVFGHTAWAVERDRSGMPSEIWWVKPDRLTPVPHEKEYLSGFLYEPISGGPPIPFSPDEIAWFRYPNPVDEFAPLSPLSAARLAADSASAMMKANRNLFTNGMQLGGMIVPTGEQVTYSTQQAQELEDLLDLRWRGVDKAHRWAVLRFDAQLKALGVTPRDAEFANGLNLTMKQVCNAYGMQSALLNDLEHATLSNVRDLERHEWVSTLVPDSQLKADEIQEQFLPLFGRTPGRSTPDHCEYDYSTVAALQESEGEKWTRERQAIEIGRKTINEIREANGEPPVKWGDVWWAPVNKSAVKGADSMPQGDTTPAEVPVEQAAGVMATLDMAALELRHGRLSLNGHLNGRKVQT